VPTTIHVPPDLLDRVDRRAAELGVSRNLYIRKALEKAIEMETRWSRPFLEMLEEAASDKDNGKVVEEMVRAIARHRRSRRKPRSL